MQLADAQIEIRPRTTMEALDLGVLLARRYWWALLAGWLVLAIPVYVAAWFMPNLYLGLLLVWWCKPLYERIPLTIVSSSIFRHQASWSTMRRNVLAPDCWLWLTLFRFFPGRSTLSPIAALEADRPRESVVSARRSLIKDRTMGTYIWLHFLGWVVELCLVVFVFVWVLWIFSPIKSDFDLTLEPIRAIAQFLSQLNSTSWLSKLILTLFFAAYAVVAPFYVCSGFSLYLNRRIELEGWDIDLGFRKLVQRAAPILGVFIAVLLCTDPTWAQESDPDPSNERKNAIHSEIREIIESDPVSVERAWRPLEVEEARPMRVGAFWQPVLQTIVWLILIGIVVFLVIQLRVWEYGRYFRRARGESTTKTRNVPILKRELDLPDDISAAATAKWNSGLRREALSLLYRGALYALISRHRCKIDASFTEAACMRTVKKEAPTLSNPFNSITTNWQKLAYANRAVAESDFANLRDDYVENFEE